MVRSKMALPQVGSFVVMVFLIQLSFNTFGQAGDKKAQRARQERRVMCRENADKAFQVGDWGRAKAYYDSTLALGFLEDVALQRAKTCLLLKDSVGYCSGIMEVAPYRGEVCDEQFRSVCIRKDSVVFEASGLSVWNFAGAASVARQWNRWDGRTIHHLYGGDDSLLVAISTSPSDTIFFITDSMADYPGGIGELFRYLSTVTRYPQDALDQGRSGIAYVEFMIGIDGSLRDFRVIKSGGMRSMDQEALRVLKAMPTWTPGFFRGQPVTMQMSVPVRFTIR
ncbi:MAG: energy transducer TonB [Flavobacteriales bacterium]|nr:energy transducer TonB [Flavobacteriales bacterium]